MDDVMNYIVLANIYERKNVSLMEKNKYIMKKLIVPMVLGMTLIIVGEILLF